ncbi:MAG: hypothetical protein AABY32_05115 [Nanoarchaeota archaeon]
MAKKYNSKQDTSLGYVVSNIENMIELLSINPSFHNIMVEEDENKKKILTAQVPDGKKYIIKKILKSNPASKWYEIDLLEMKKGEN